MAVNPLPLQKQFSDPRGPAPFEQATYEPYLRARSETRGLAKATAVSATILVSVVILGLQVEEAAFGLFKVGSLKRNILVGLIGWFTLLSASYTLILAAYTAQKKRQSGPFYQQVLQLSGHPLLKLGDQVAAIVFVGVFLAVISLTIIVARDDMIKLVDFIIREILLFLDPWRPVIKPGLSR
jgi:hypothetical protein